MKESHRLGRFFGIPENIGLFEKLVFRFCQSSSTENPEKDEEPEKNKIKKANVSQLPGIAYDSSHVGTSKEGKTQP